MEKLTLEDALMVENVVAKLNEMIEETEYLNKRIDRLWKYLRMNIKEDKKND